MRWNPAWLVTLVALVAVGCGGGDGGRNDGDGDTLTDTTVVGDDDDDDVSHSTTPWTEVETTQAECCRSVELSFEFTETGSEELGRWAYAVPEGPIGAVVVFHGSNGSIAAVQQTEWLELYNLLYPRGIGLILVNSPDRDTKQWSEEPVGANPDVDAVEAVLAEVSATTAWDIDDPLISIGFSNGAKFANLFAEDAKLRGRDVKGAVMHQGSFDGLGEGLPGLWVSAENDDAGGGPERMDDNATAQGNGSLHLRGTEVALHPNRFAKIPSVQPEESQAYFDYLVEEKIIDADGWRLFAFDADPDEQADGLERYLPFPAITEVVTQLRVVWAIHRFSAQHKVEEAAWIEAQLLR